MRSRSLKIKYFDTVPVASGLSILRSGFLFLWLPSTDLSCSIHSKSWAMTMTCQNTVRSITTRTVPVEDVRNSLPSLLDR